MEDYKKQILKNLGTEKFVSISNSGVLPCSDIALKEKNLLTTRLDELQKIKSFFV